jgi:hypothetical protein
MTYYGAEARPQCKGTTNCYTRTQYERDTTFLSDTNRCRVAQNMPNDMSQKVAVFTGSSKGIGKAIAMEFAKEGYNQVLNARDQKEVHEAANEITKVVEKDVKRISYLAGGHIR